MGRNGSVSTPGTRIRTDNMDLTVTDIHPDFEKQSEREARQEISARLYRIFQTYGESYASGDKN